jgi:acetyl/propionyl-CoA carboxylase alpha subunit
VTITAAVHLGTGLLGQRRQKLIEEAPRYTVDQQRSRMCETAVKCCWPPAIQRRHGGIHRRPDGNFYFMEINARIQVEHPARR